MKCFRKGLLIQHDGHVTVLDSFCAADMLASRIKQIALMLQIYDSTIHL